MLRRAGIDVHPGRMIDVVEALGHVNLAARDEVYHTCRALLVHRPEQLAVFDLAFDTFWRQRLGRLSSAAAASKLPTVNADMLQPPPSQELVAHVGSIADSNEEAPSFDNAVKTWSDRGGVAGKDFAVLSDAERVEARLALERLVWNPRRTSHAPLGSGTRTADRPAARHQREPPYRRRHRHLQAPGEGRPAAPAGPPL